MNAARYGAAVADGQTRFTVRSPRADQVWLCRFAPDGRETRLRMVRDGTDWTLTLPEDLSGTAYGYRAEGPYDPPSGLWFDPAKLLVDPYAVELDRRFAQHPSLAQFGEDTAPVVPRAVVPVPFALPPPAPPAPVRGGLIYEVNVRGFTMLHPQVPPAQRGTVAALAHPAVIAHLRKLHVSAVELMPVVGWIDERHLPPLGLVNAWGYNPVALMALDPGLCPGGVAELRETVAALHAHGIGMILDLVFNHTGESDANGGTLSLRGLDDSAHAHAPDGSLINDTGCGNTLDFAQAWVRRLTLDALRHFTLACGVDGFRFDLAPVLARGPGFDAEAPFFAELAADPVLAGRILIAEPWDCGPGGYQLGRFPAGWLEWNDVYRDDVRRFWRGDGGIGALATRIAGSTDIFGANTPENPTRTVNFLAAHDGFTLADMLAYEQRHNHANGEDNRDGHAANHSWNNGVEGPSDDPAVLARRAAAVRALLGTLLLSAGTIMLTAGDECGRSQQGNNNAYAQDNATTWLDWEHRDRDLEDWFAERMACRSARRERFVRLTEPGLWQDAEGNAMNPAGWESPATGAVSYQAEGMVLQIDRASGMAEFRAD